MDQLFLSKIEISAVDKGNYTLDILFQTLIVKLTSALHRHPHPQKCTDY